MAVIPNLKITFFYILNVGYKKQIKTGLKVYFRNLQPIIHRQMNGNLPLSLHLRVFERFLPAITPGAKIEI